MNKQPREVRTQSLLDFTVQIRRKRDNAIIGTGIAVSLDGKIVTCSHVAEGALEIHPRKAKNKELIVYFPQIRGAEEKKQRAKVLACFPQHDDDIVLLKLVNEQSPLAPEQIPKLGRAEGCEGHKFRSYGFVTIGEYRSKHVDGLIMGPVIKDLPKDVSLHADMIELKTGDIRPGISGGGVLDIEKENLIVGVISERFVPFGAEEKTEIGWAVNARVLSLEPLGLPLEDKPYPMKVAPTPKMDVEKARAAVAAELKNGWNNAPTLIEEWVGREDLLGQISEDWENPDISTTGLIGFGGEGKSSLARQWLENLLKDKTQPQPDGIFWWGFYTKPSSDEFFEAALKYMSGGKVDPREYPSASAKAHFIAAMLHSKRVIFILDGLEVLQNQTGDRYGLLKSNNLRNFLEYFSSGKHGSFCLITSRAPMLDLMDYNTYNHRDVMRMSKIDGRDLLRKVGVKGKNKELDKVVQDWDGHALTLNLIGACLMEEHDGDVKYASEIEPPTADEPRYDRVHRVLRRYDDNLKDEDKAFLKLFSAFRNPVKEDSFEKVFRADMGPKAINSPISKLNDTEFKAIIKRLVTCRILRYDPADKSYTAHPLIRKHYEDEFVKGGKAAVKKAHEKLKEYYTEIAGDVPNNPTLDDLKPWIEVVHHACKAGYYQEAFDIHWEKITQKEDFVLTSKLGAYDLELEILMDFYPNSIIKGEPLVDSHNNKAWLINEIGLCFTCLGNIYESIEFFKTSNDYLFWSENFSNLSRGYTSISFSYMLLGELEIAAEMSKFALNYSRRGTVVNFICDSIEQIGWINYLKGDLKKSYENYKEAVSISKQLIDEHFLTDLRGIHHAYVLIKMKKERYARRIIENNLRDSIENKMIDRIGSCNIVLGLLESINQKNSLALDYYYSALKIARSIAVRHLLIESLLSLGLHKAKHLILIDDAFDNLNEALEYATDGGYRIYEADIRVALAWAHIAKDEYDKAREQAEYAKRLSEDMGYYWGKVDAEDVLTVLE